MVSIFNNIKLVILLIAIILLTGCYNKYYLEKKIDAFNPNINDKFTIYYNNNTEYYSSIFNKLANEFTKIPMVYSANPFVLYSVYFDNKKRFFFLPVFRVTIVKQNNTLSLPDEVVYDSLVYSYRFNTQKSLIASLKIISSDIVNAEYKKSKYIKVNNDDIEDFLKQKITKIDLKKGGDLENYKSTKKEYIKYKLYNKLEAYK